jgi:hypothetical protein
MGPARFFEPFLISETENWVWVSQHSTWRAKEGHTNFNYKEGF